MARRERLRIGGWSGKDAVRSRLEHRQHRLSHPFNPRARNAPAATPKAPNTAPMKKKARSIGQDAEILAE
jgi:hypothetical protein